MRYLLALIFPPGAVILSGGTVAALCNLGLWLLAVVTVWLGVGFLLYLVTAVHACLVVSAYYSDTRVREMQAAVREAVALLQPVPMVKNEPKPEPKPEPMERKVWKIYSNPTESEYFGAGEV